MKQKKQLLLTWSYYAVLTLIGLGMLYIAFKWLMPCVISILIVMALQPLISNIVKMSRLENKFVTLVVTIVVYLVIIGLVIYLVFLGMVQLCFLFEKLPGYLDEIRSFIESSPLLKYINGYADVFYESLNEVVQNCSTAVIDFIIAFLGKIPSLAFDVMFIVISSLFFILDYRNIKEMILKYSKREEYIRSIVSCVKETISSVFKAYLSIFVITFIGLLISFYSIGLEDALMLAFSIAVFDFLPILGLDMIFIPWIVLVAFQNQMSFAISLLVVYIIISIIKNIVEPKLLSKHIGMHPLLTIVSMFIGVKFLGLLGMIFVPLIIMIAKRIYVLNRGEYT